MGSTMKKSHPLQDSFLYPINDQVCASRDFDSAKLIILTHLRLQKGRDVTHMIHVVEHDIHTHDRLIKWFYNNLLAYSGNKVVKFIPR